MAAGETGRGPCLPAGNHPRHPGAHGELAVPFDLHPAPAAGNRHQLGQVTRRMVRASVAQLRYILWDHDGVLVDTEEWYFQATRRAQAEVGVDLKRADYQEFRARGKTAWDLARQAGVAEPVIAHHRAHRDTYYQEYLRREEIAIPGVEEVLALLKDRYKMAIVTTSKRADFDLIHRSRSIVKHMEFVLTVEDYEKEKPS
ncbi:MAG: hypothetical protein E4H48_00215, partial [Syntrophobacterales bacterium]